MSTENRRWLASFFGSPGWKLVAPVINSIEDNALERIRSEGVNVGTEALATPKVIEEVRSAIRALALDNEVREDPFNGI